MSSVNSSLTNGQLYNWVFIYTDNNIMLLSVIVYILGFTPNNLPPWPTQESCFVSCLQIETTSFVTPWKVKHLSAAWDVLLPLAGIYTRVSAEYWYISIFYTHSFFPWIIPVVRGEKTSCLCLRYYSMTTTTTITYDLVLEESANFTQLLWNVCRRPGVRAKYCLATRRASNKLIHRYRNRDGVPIIRFFELTDAFERYLYIVYIVRYSCFASSCLCNKGNICLQFWSSLLQDPRFNQEVDKQTGFRTRNILCMPILNYEGEIMGVAQIMNKTDAEGFTTEDEKVRTMDHKFKRQRLRLTRKHVNTQFDDRRMQFFKQ